MTQSLIDRYKELHGAIGTVIDLQAGRVTAREFDRFSAATTASDDPTLKVTLKAEAHPIYLSAVMGWVDARSEADLRGDGSDPAPTAGLPLEGLRLMGAGQDLEFHRPTTAGMEIRIRASIDDVQMKNGNQGDLLLVTIRREYVDQTGEPVLTCLESVIAR